MAATTDSLARSVGFSPGEQGWEAAGDARRPLSRDSAPRQVWIDKNLAALGFFTPSSQRIKRERSKTVRLSPAAGAERAEVSVTIVPSALHGLPVTADQDKYLALHDVVRCQTSRGALVSNPLSFSSAALLRSLGLCDSGRNHLEVSEWLDLMSSTTIISEGAVYLAGSRRWARDRFRVFDRAVSRGQALEDGSVAERNHVWLSDWQLQNINNRHLLPIDLDVYCQLRTHIARSLVLHLQIWLYASQRAQVFEKRYSDICQLLGLRAYDHHSKIVEKLGPALEELATHRYLSGWAVARTADARAFKLVLRHGELFTRPRPIATSLAKPAGRLKVAPPTAERSLPEPLPRPESAQADDFASMDALKARGVTPRRARQLLTALGPGHDILRQLEWGDFVISRLPPGTIWNPAGFFISLLRDSVEPPSYFLSSRQRAAKDDARQAFIEERAHSQLLRDVEQHHVDEEVNMRLAAMEAAGLNDAVSIRADSLRSQFPLLRWTEESLRSVALESLRSELARQVRDER